MIWLARRSSLAAGFERPLGTPSTSPTGTISSAKCIVDMASAPSRGRTAARYCLLRITTLPMPTRSASSIAAWSSWYALDPLSSAPSQ